MVLSSGDNWDENPGAMAVLDNSTFKSNKALADNGGVINMGEFTTVNILGHENVFEFNQCEEDGSILAASTNTLVTVEGGDFFNNSASVSKNLIILIMYSLIPRTSRK